MTTEAAVQATGGHGFVQLGDGHQLHRQDGKALDDAGEFGATTGGGDGQHGAAGWERPWRRLVIHAGGVHGGAATGGVDQDIVTVGMALEGLGQFGGLRAISRERRAGRHRCAAVHWHRPDRCRW